jgi:DNA-3-methyladenine glycosylase I
MTTTRPLPDGSYCKAADGHPLHGPYHDQEYGFPRRSDEQLFERLILEINQAGLSWATILRKRDSFAAAYDGFDVDTVASYGEADVRRLMADPGIVRNRLKVQAAIHNARVVATIRESTGSFANWLDAHHPRSKAEWVRLFRSHFRFTGGEITGEFLISLGYLPGAHVEECPTFKRVLAADPPWTRV